MNSRCAIVAADLVTALGRGPEDHWAQIMRDVCGIRPMARFERGRYRTECAGEISDETWAFLREGEPRSGVGLAYLLGLSVGRQALRQAAPIPQRTGLILASTKGEIQEIEAAAGNADAHLNGRWNPGTLARELARELGLGRPVLAVSSACASGLSAIIQAARVLGRGDAEMVLVVGVDVLSDFVLSGFSALNALSSRPCRPYDVARDGLSLGEGAAAMVLTREPGTRPVLATVSGWGVAGDAAHITRPSPEGDGLASALSAALATARLAPSDVQYINGHGTATVQNDDMEAEALHRIFGPATPPVSSLKGYIGHTLGAAGVIEAVLCIVAMQHDTIPGCMGLQTPGLPKPLNLAQDDRAAPGLTNVLTIKAGFGGVNAAVILARGEGRA